MKRIITMILCIATAFGISACGSAPVPAATPSPTGEDEIYAYNQAASNSLTYISDYSVLLETLQTAQSSGNGERMYTAAGTDTASTQESMTRESAAEEPAAAESDSVDYSGTNVQVAGVDEGDIVKTDGEYIYVVSGYELIIFKASGPDTVEVSRVTIGYDDSSDGENDWSYKGKSPSELFVNSDRLAVVSSYYSYHEYEGTDGIWQSENESYLTADIYDVSDPTAPVNVCSLGQDGSETASRMIDGRIYIVSEYYVYDYDGTDPITFVPCTFRDGERSLISAECISIMPNISSTSYAVIGVYDLESGEMLSSQTVLGAGDTIYMNDSSLYLATGTQEEHQSDPYALSVYTVTDYSWRSATEICRFSLSDGVVTPGSVATLEGDLNNQFSMDEYNGNLRVVTTLNGYDYKIYRDEAMGFENYVSGDEYETSCSLYILDSETMQSVGSITDLAKGENIYSVRFDGDWAYFCTYETVDPLFAVDVSDPAAPTVVSELEITGFSEYLHVWTDGLLFGLGQETVMNTEGDNEWTTTDGMKLVMFDTSDKANVTAKSVLNIDADWSEALYNHKAILIDYEKNMIGFPAGDGYDIYGWTEEQGFLLRARIETGGWSWGMRGLYIGSYVYVVTDSKVTVLDITDFILAATLEY